MATTSNASVEMPVAARSPVARLVAGIVFEPGRTVGELASSPRHAMPIATLAVGTALMLAWYYSRLDYSWFAEYLVGANPILASVGRKFTLRRETVMLPATLSAAVNIMLAWLLTSVYLWLAAKLAGADRPAGQWFALASWACVPQILVLPLSVALVWMHPDGRFGPEQLDPTTIEMLLGGIAPGNPWHAVASRIGIASAWSWAILAIGFRRWTGATMLAALATVVAPYALYIGGQYAFALLR